MASRSYHVIGGVASSADISNSLLAADMPKLAVLGAVQAEEVTATASCGRTPRSFFFLSVRHRPIARSGGRQRSTDAFHCLRRPNCLSALFDEFSTAISRSLSRKLHHVRRLLRHPLGCRLRQSRRTWTRGMKPPTALFRREFVTACRSVKSRFSGTW
jgi:hypothetical protein